MRLLGVLIATSLWCQPFVAQVPSGDAVAAMDRTLASLERDLAKYAEPFSTRGINGRFEQARARFTSMDYQGTLALLRPLLRTPLTQAQHAEMLHMVAESLFQLEDNHAAMVFFGKLLNGQDKTQKPATLIRLMELSDRVDDFDKFQENFNLYIGLGQSLTSEVRYLQGKRLFLATQDEKAVEALTSISSVDAHYMRGQYIIGAALLRLGRFEQALPIFERLAKADTKTLVDRSVKDLAMLAKARAHYSRDQMRDAVLAYRRLPMDSTYVMAMLYELCSAYIRYGDLTRTDLGSVDSDVVKAENARRLYESGYNTLKMLLAWDKKSAKDPKVRLLYADLLIRFGKDNKAASFFEGVSTDFEAIQALLDEADREPAALIASKFGETETTSTPSQAHLWVSEQREMKKIERVKQDIHESAVALQALQAEYTHALSTLKQDLGSSEAFLTRSLLKLLAIETSLLELKKAEASAYLEKVTGGLGAGGKLKLGMKSSLVRGYVARTVDVSLDGVLIYSGPLPASIDRRLKSGRHVLAVEVDYQALGGDVFEVIHYKAKLQREFEGKSGQIQEMNLDLVDGDEEAQKPKVLLTNQTVVSDFVQLLPSEWEQIERVIEERAKLEQEWRAGVGNAQAEPRALQALYLRYFKTLEKEEDLLRAASLRASSSKLSVVPPHSALSDLSTRASTQVSLLFGYLDMEYESFSSGLKAQLAALDETSKSLNASKQEFYPAASKALSWALPYWHLRSYETLKSSSSGMLQGILKEQYKTDRRIRQIEQVKAAELERLDKEFDFGGAP